MQYAIILNNWYLPVFLKRVYYFIINWGGKALINRVNKKLFVIMILLSLLMALLVELLNLSKTSVFEIEGNYINLYNSSNVSMDIYNYNNLIDRFTVEGEDPQIVFNCVNYDTESILISLSSPIVLNTPIKIYYTSDSIDNFNEIDTIEGVIPQGTKEYYIDCELIHVQSIRFDIEGNFSLSNIVLSDSDMSTSIISETFNITRMFFLLILIFLIMLAFYLWFVSPKTSAKITNFEMIYCLFCGVFYFIWAIIKPFNYAPDEYMRYDVSRFIYDNNRLPIGTETINIPWGFSYSHYPTFLCNLFSYIPMKIVGMFTNDFYSILVAARLVSVICGTLTVYFVIKTSKLMFGKPINWIMVVMVSMLPQFAFLSSYVNNDIVTMLGSSIILYAWCKAYKNKICFKTSVALACGIVICTLAYYNSYGWIVLSILFFISYYIIRKNERKNFIKYSLLISTIVLVFCSYFFIRHLHIYDDLLGFNTVNKYSELFALDSYKPSARMPNTIKSLGFSIIDMLFSTKISSVSWIKSSYLSFIEYFGYMSVKGSEYVYWIYSIIFLFAAYVLSVYSIFYFRRFKWSEIILKAQDIIFYICISFSAIIPIVLSIIYSYKSDYQPQGRYFITALLAIAFLTTRSLNIVISKIKNKNTQDAVVYSLCQLLVFVTFGEFFVTYIGG